MKSKSVRSPLVSKMLVGNIVATILGLSWSAAWTGFTLSILWSWFIVSNFNLPHLSIADGYGVALILRAGLGLRDVETKVGENFADSFQKLMWTAPCASGLFLALGYAATSWAKAGT